MLKGHAKIELTDVKSGIKKTFEHDNMFTKAVANSLNNGWVQMAGGLNTLKSWYLPLVKTALGGVVLFGDTIDEDEDITFFPEGNPVIGYAGDIASDGTSKYWGSKNLLESEDYDPETKTVKWVWDFGTAQGNGTIKALGLMSGAQADYYGDSVWHKLYNRRLDVSAYFSSFGYRIVEWDGDVITWMENGTGKVTIKKSRFNLDKVTLNNTIGTAELISSDVVALPLSSVNYNSMFWKDGYDGYWYGFIIMASDAFDRAYSNDNSYGTGNRYMQIVRINKETFAVESHNITLPQGYYAALPAVNPIITKNYICFGTSTNMGFRDKQSSGVFGSTTYNSSYIRKDKIIKVSLNDWTVAVTELEDENGEKYFMYPNTYTSDFAASLRFGAMFENIRLPNGTYQMNDMILDDDCKVVKQLKPPFNPNTGVPVKASSEYQNAYTILTPWATCVDSDSGDFYTRPMGWVLNRKKNLILMFGRQSGAYYALIMPLYCQQLFTINNLLDPVVKSSTQSMKITYTVTDVEEDT